MIVLIIIILALINIYLLNKKTENYDHHTDCTSCKNKGYYQCRNCVNCGVCTTAMGDMYCANGDINGPYNRTDCLKWDFGNIYPQYQPQYYHQNPTHLGISTDARFYPYFKTLDDTTGTQYFNKEFLNNFYKNFNNTLKGDLYKR